MNKSNFIGWFFLFGLSVSSCDDTTISAPQGEIKLVGAIVSSSRGTDLNQQATKIVENRQVGVTITQAHEAHDNGLWLADGNGTLVNVSNPVHWGDTEVTDLEKRLAKAIRSIAAFMTEHFPMLNVQVGLT